MKHCIVVLVALALAACGGGAATTSTGQLTGAANARRAVETFLGAVKAQDLQAMSSVWGTSKGPARDVVDRAQLEKRELIMQCYLSHDSFVIANDVATKADTHQLQVRLTKGRLTRETTFTAVQGPSDRWYVLDAQLEPVRDLCAQP